MKAQNLLRKKDSGGNAPGKGRKNEIISCHGLNFIK